MERVARVADGVVVEILSAPDGMSIRDCFHPGVLATCVLCADDVQVGWVYQDGVLYDPANPPSPPEVVVEPVEVVVTDEPVVE